MGFDAVQQRAVGEGEARHLFVFRQQDGDLGRQRHRPCDCTGVAGINHGRCILPSPRWGLWVPNWGSRTHTMTFCL